jgi:hypothetical protein
MNQRYTYALIDAICYLYNPKATEHSDCCVESKEQAIKIITDIAIEQGFLDSYINKVFNVKTKLETVEGLKKLFGNAVIDGEEYIVDITEFWGNGRLIPHELTVKARNKFGLEWRNTGTGYLYFRHVR